ncbi:MAG TPA: hydantoinase/oxoprolinase family protein [Bacillota bacterium]|nr:hydantoinase/oxoprolinase family protein [Bacillota bacterium]
MVIVGIDVGGTNTDAALISEGRILATAKVPTCHDQLLESTTLAFEKLLNAYDRPDLSDPIELHLSTTLSTNAIIEGQGDPTAVLAAPGPGMNVAELNPGFPIYVLSGSMDHRGREVAPINQEEVLDAVSQAEAGGATALAVVGKFSHRNPGHELEIEKLILKRASKTGRITLGHRLSGRPNFPRRMATSYLNASIARHQAVFVDMIRKFMVRDRSVGRVFLLKADGGTMQLEDSLIRPVETILSGPAASIMGAEALSAYPDSNTVILDIGGTTTDISVQIKGDTVFQRQGAEIAGYKTLVPALFSRSIGLGGDSEIKVVRRLESNKETDASLSGNNTLDLDIELEIGPRRAGTPAAFGGDCITPTDAAVALGLAKVGSASQATRALADFAEIYGIGAKELATKIIDTFIKQLVVAIEETYEYLESRPVYTVSEILTPPDIRPQALIGLGAPAGVFIPPIAESLGLKYQVLPCYESANAIGAAASRPTAQITLHADTALGVMTVPEADYVGKIERPVLFGINQARREAMAWATKFGKKLGLDEADNIQIVEEESFNMVRGFHTVGRTFMIRAQVRPGVRRICSSPD